MNLGTILTVLLLVFAASIGVYILAWRASGRWYLKRSKSLAAMFRKAQWKLQEKHPDPLEKCWYYPGSTNFPYPPNYKQEFTADTIAEEIDEELKAIYLAEQQRAQQQGKMYAWMGSAMGQARGRLTGLDQAGRSWWNDLFNRLK